MKKSIYILCLLLALAANAQDLLMHSVFEQGSISDKPVIRLTELLASPIAEGHGARTTGGRGGKLIIVNSMDDDNIGAYDASCDCYKGTLKYAQTRDFVKTVTFAASGAILSSNVTNFFLDDATYGNMTIVGATAPFPGVILYGARYQIEPALGNYNIRGLTFTVGTGGTAGVEVPFSVKGDNLFLSDITAGWGNDQTMDISVSKSGTLQHSFGFEAEPAHNTGSIIGGNTSQVGTGPLYEGFRISFHNNAYAHISHRFPNGAGDSNSFLDHINIVVYNMRNRLSRYNCSPNINHISNYVKLGPDRGASGMPTRLNKYSAFRDGGNDNCIQDPKIYTSGNIITGYFEDENADNSVLWEQFLTTGGFVQNDPLPINFFATNPHPQAVDPIHIRSAADAYKDLIVQKNIGARYYTDQNGRPVFYRLPFVDAYLDDAINGTALAQLGDRSLFVLPALPVSGTPYADTDEDSMPDTFEIVHGLNSNDRTDAMLTTKNRWEFDAYIVINDAGYENREIFYHWINGDYQRIIDSPQRYAHLLTDNTN